MMAYLCESYRRVFLIYPLAEILLLVLCGVMAGADDCSEITRWGKLHLEFLRRFLPFDDSILSPDTVNDVLNALDGEAFREACVSWMTGLRAADQDGDMMHHALQCIEPDWSTCLCWDAAESARSRRMVLDAVADTDTLVMPAHFPGTSAGHVVAAGDNYRFRFVDG